MSFTTAWSTNAVAVCHACGLARRPSHRALAALPAAQLAADLRGAARGLPGLGPRPHDRVPVPRAAASLRHRGRAPQPVFEVPLLARGAGGARAHQPRAGPRLRRLGPRLLHRALRATGSAATRPASSASTSPSRTASTRATGSSRAGSSSTAREAPDTSSAWSGRRSRPTRTTASSPSTTTRARSAATASRTLRARPRPARPSPLAAAGARRARPLHRRDPQLPVRRRALPGRRDRHRRPDPRRPRHRPGLARRRRHRRLLRRQPAHPGLRAAVGGPRASPTRRTWRRRSRSRSRPRNGASDYGNKFGEPVIQGYTRSFGLRLPDGERREWIKPIMFTGGIGQHRRPPHRKAAARARHAGGARSAARPTGSAWAAARPRAWSRARTSPSSTSTPCSAATPRWSRSSTASSAPASSWATATRSSASTTRAPAATATSSRRSSIPPGRRIEVRRDPGRATRPCRCSRSGAPSTRRTTRCCCARSTPSSFARPVRAREGPVRGRRADHRRRPHRGPRRARRLDARRPRPGRRARRHAAEDLRARSRVQPAARRRSTCLTA